MEFEVAAPPVSGKSVSLPLRLLGDERLAKLVGAGNEAAFTILYERHHQALYRYCRSLVGTDADAQDALQSAMAGALVALRGGRRDAPVRPWLFRIAHNEAISLLRRRRPEQELPEELRDAARSPHEVAEERARLALLVADLQELPERQRGALVMRELSGLSHEEVAQAFGITVGVAKQTVFEARRSLMDFTEGRAMACEDIRRLISDGDGRVLRGRRVRAHLRECTGCSLFADAIPARRNDLMVISPILPLAAATGLLARITGTSAGHGTAGGGLLAGTTSKALTLGLSGKALATGAAIVALGTAGTTGAIQVLSQPAANPAVNSSQSGHPSGNGATGTSTDSSAMHSATHRSATAGSAGMGARSATGRSAAAPGHSRSHGSSSLAPGHGGTTAPGLGGQVGSGAGAVHNKAHSGSKGASASHSQATAHSHGTTGASHRPTQRRHHRHHHRIHRSATGTNHANTTHTTPTPITPTTPTTPSPTSQVKGTTGSAVVTHPSVTSSHTAP